MDPLVPIIVDRFRGRLAYGESTDAVETVMAGIALLVAQPVIAGNPFFNEAQIKKFWVLRRNFHEQFARACEVLARDFEAGKYGPQVASAAQPLEMVSRMPANQSRQALLQTVRILRGLKRLSYRDVDPIVYRLIRQAMNIRSDTEPNEDLERHGQDYGTDYTEFFRDVIKLDVVPTQIKTLLRKVVQLGKGSGKSISLRPHEDENPGAWFEMSEEEQDKLRKAYNAAREVFNDEKVRDLPPEERQPIYNQAVQTMMKIERAAGVHSQILKSERGRPEKPLEQVLKEEARIELDGATAFAMDRILKQVASNERSRREYQRPKPRKKDPDLKPWERSEKKPKPVSLSREVVKLLALLRKARTFETVERIIREAADQQIIPKEMLETVQKISEDVGKNKAVREGIPLAPLHFKPMSVAEFRAAHDTGEVELPHDMPEDQQQELLGRVSRAISDLESVFGKGFCGKHRKKLAFRFNSGTNVMATAHYFAWDNRNEWQPRVTFGEDYEGVLAHELSHYFEDLIAARLDEKMEADRPPEDKRKYRMEGGPGDIFGRVSAEYFTESFVEGTYAGRKDALHEILPEAFELMSAVVNTPDYARWEDKLTNSHVMSIEAAVKNLTGMSMYDLPKGHPYEVAKDAGWGGAQYKSELPPELVAEIERVYTRMMDGDSRKLHYYQSAAEVWARMCEQYVYTKLSKAGIANPWLTWMHYDQDVYVEEARFEKEIAPIFDRLFAKLGTRNILAAIIRRYMAAMTQHTAGYENQINGKFFSLWWGKSGWRIEESDEPIGATADMFGGKKLDTYTLSNPASMVKSKVGPYLAGQIDPGTVRSFMPNKIKADDKGPEVRQKILEGYQWFLNEKLQGLKEPGGDPYQNLPAFEKALPDILKKLVWKRA